MPNTLDKTDQSGELAVAYSQLGPHEREILCDVAHRLLLGQSSYGQFRDTDGRNFVSETYQELLDGIIYSARHLRRIA